MSMSRRNEPLPPWRSSSLGNCWILKKQLTITSTTMTILLRGLYYAKLHLKSVLLMMMRSFSLPTRLLSSLKDKRPCDLQSPGVTFSPISDDDQFDSSASKEDQPVVHKMNLRSGNKVPGQSRHKGKGKISQSIEGSKALESLMDIPSPGVYIGIMSRPT